MTSPSPTQAPPTQTPPPIPEYKPALPAERKPDKPERKPVRATPVRRRLGDALPARIIKGILRPPIKVLYYLSTWTRKHKLSTLAIILLLLVSTSATTYYLTGDLPFGIQHDPFNFAYNGGKGEGQLVQGWLYALRDGDVTHLQLLDKDMATPPDPSQLVGQFSQTKAHITWGAATVVGTQKQPDTTVDSFVQIPISATGPGNVAKGVILFHFLTASVNGQDVLLAVDPISIRALQS